ncbi:ubiquinone biosynthesis protein, putative [Cordyceps militaris CM01]|uniref:Ubiquinone biosynthesis protein, putative n=2 Tax=Cordyceps militaris TaxID=73501 RepID=G3JF26_CORMM|nr:ubiquinone biosynthesis protein, putative [Cordyceps militaris CM01]ATY65096.1 ubiquinone biosynthesis [Cordyceps militaris]EGX93082.1 ubiquinone biosynthesis protein, putative [Cordyceps militaris CM01]
MRVELLLGRFTLRSGLRQASGFKPTSLVFRPQCARYLHAPRRIPWRGSGKRSNGSALRASAGGAAAIGTAAFVKLAQKDNGGTDETGELRMLELSREEIRKAVDNNDRGLSRLVHEALLFLDLYIWEPIFTGVRFLHLVAIFVPVIVSVPIVWLGRRLPERDDERQGTLWWYGFMVKAMELAGPAFIKLGQWAASRSDIFPNELCESLSKLHSNAPAHSMRVTRATVEAAFGGRPFEEIFDEFEEKPLGVGAIAQVYKAKLKPDVASPADSDIVMNKDMADNVKHHVKTVLMSSPSRVPSTYVAIKVLHPHVERTVRRDLRIMGFFASMLNAIPTMEWLSLPGEVEQFGEMMKLQLDLRIEAANLATFRQNFKDRSTAWFPYPYTDFTTRNVLIEEYAQGIPLADFMENGGGVFQHDIADEGLDAFLRMLLLDNFVHADLHPGNIMVRFYRSARPELPMRRAPDAPPAAHDPSDVTEEVLERLRPYRRDRTAWQAELATIDAEGFRPQLVFIDTGLVTELNATNRKNFLDLFRAVAEFDGYKAGHLMCERCRQPEAVLDKEVFALKMQHLVLSVKSRTLALGNVKIGDILQQVLAMVRGHHVRLEGDFVNVVISILLLEGIGRSLNPDVDLLSSSLPILRQLSTQRAGGVGDFSMVLLWVGLETRKFLQASIEDVERCVKYDLLSPNV